MALVGVHDWFDLRRVGGTGCGLWGWCGTSHRWWNGRRYASPITPPSRHHHAIKTTNHITLTGGTGGGMRPRSLHHHATITPSKQPITLPSRHPQHPITMPRTRHPLSKERALTRSTSFQARCRLYLQTRTLSPTKMP